MLTLSPDEANILTGMAATGNLEEATELFGELKERLANDALSIAHAILGLLDGKNVRKTAACKVALALLKRAFCLHLYYADWPNNPMETTCASKGDPANCACPDLEIYRSTFKKYKVDIPVVQGPRPFLNWPSGRW